MLTLNGLLEKALAGRNAARAVVEELWAEVESMRVEIAALKAERIATASRGDKEPLGEDSDEAAETTGEDTRQKLEAHRDEALVAALTAVYGSREKAIEALS